MPHFVYILYSPSLNQFYKGQTSDLDDRVKRHNVGYESATHKGCPWVLLWHTVKENRSQAVVLETKLKNLSRERLIAFMLKYPSPVSSPDELLILKQLSGC